MTETPPMANKSQEGPDVGSASSKSSSSSASASSPVTTSSNDSEASTSSSSSASPLEEPHLQLPPPSHSLTASEELRTQICSNQFCQCVRRDKKILTLPEIIRARLLQRAQHQLLQQQQQQQQRQKIQQDHLEREAREVLVSLDALVDQSRSKSLPRVQLIHAPVVLPGNPKPVPQAGAAKYHSHGKVPTRPMAGLPAQAWETYKNFSRHANRVETDWKYPKENQGHRGVVPLAARSPTALVTTSSPLLSVSSSSPLKRKYQSWALGVPQTIDTPVPPEVRRRTSETSELSFQSISEVAQLNSMPSPSMGTDDDLHTHIVSVATAASAAVAAMARH